MGLKKHEKYDKMIPRNEKTKNDSGYIILKKLALTEKEINGCKEAYLYPKNKQNSFILSN